MYDQANGVDRYTCLETYILAVRYMDLYMQKNLHPTLMNVFEYMQSIAIACLRMAAKMNDTAYYPRFQTLGLKNPVNKPWVNELEGQILQAVDCDLNVPTCYQFASLLKGHSGCETDTQFFKGVSYWCFLAARNEIMHDHNQSKIACAMVYFTRDNMGLDWNEELELITGYKEEDFLDVVRELNEAHCQFQTIKADKKENNFIWYTPEEGIRVVSDNEVQFHMQPQEQVPQEEVIIQETGIDPVFTPSPEVQEVQILFSPDAPPNNVNVPIVSTQDPRCISNQNPFMPPMEDPCVFQAESRASPEIVSPPAKRPRYVPVCSSIISPTNSFLDTPVCSPTNSVLDTPVCSPFMSQSVPLLLTH